MNSSVSIMKNNNSASRFFHYVQINEFCEKNEFFEFKEDRVPNDIHHVEFSPDSKVLAIGTSESKILFFDVRYRTLIDEIDLNIEPLNIYGFTFDRDGNHLIASINQRIYLFQFE